MVAGDALGERLAGTRAACSLLKPEQLFVDPII